MASATISRRGFIVMNGIGMAVDVSHGGDLSGAIGRRGYRDDNIRAVPGDDFRRMPGELRVS